METRHDPFGLDRGDVGIGSSSAGLRASLVASGPWPTVEECVGTSTEIWARDVRAAYEHARDRFADVSWEAEQDADDGNEGGFEAVGPEMGLRDSRIWGHKAIIYARAPRAFKDRYFAPRHPAARSPGLVSPSSPFPEAGPSRLGGASSSLSVTTGRSEATLRASPRPATHRDDPAEHGVLRLTHGDTPELFAAQLEWLYTGEGFGDVVEWISNDDDPLSASTGRNSLRDSLGRRGNQADRRDKLGQDLTYTWRSKLYADVRIHLDDLADDTGGADGDRGSDSDSSTGSWSSSSIFPAHRFILASRSPYFASVLLNPSNFRPQTADVHLPTPPFTPASLHFCLGYLYAGHLDFSNRSFDLPTACQIYRAAGYLQLEPLQEEIVARLVHDFCHGLDVAKCRCSRCPLRAAAVWRFTCSPEVGEVRLARAAQSYIRRRWSEALGREVGLAEEKDRDLLQREIIEGINPKSVISSLIGITAARDRIEQARRKSRDAEVWASRIDTMLEKIDHAASEGLLSGFAKVAESKAFWDLLLGKGFSDDHLERICSRLVELVGDSNGYLQAPAVYQSIVSSILLKVDPISQEVALAPRSRGRQLVEGARLGVLGHVKRRWMQIRDAGKFDQLENWALKEISDGASTRQEPLSPSAIARADKVAEIDVPVSELLSEDNRTGGSRPRKSVPAGLGLPRTSSRISTLSEVASSDNTSVRSRGFVRSAGQRTGSQLSPTTTTSTAGDIVGPATAQTEAPTPAPVAPPTEPNGLRRLRLSSSTSVSTTASVRVVPGARPAPAETTGPQARSPTAARTGRTVAVGSADARARVAARLARETSPTPSARRTPMRAPMSGPPRPLLTRAGPRVAGGSSSSTVASPVPTSAAQSNAEAGPSRLPGREDVHTPDGVAAAKEAATPKGRPSPQAAPVSNSPRPSVSSVRTARTGTSTATTRTVKTAKTVISAAQNVAPSAGSGQPNSGAICKQPVRDASPALSTASNRTTTSTVNKPGPLAPRVSVKNAAAALGRATGPAANTPNASRRPPALGPPLTNRTVGRATETPSPKSAVPIGRTVPAKTTSSVRSRITALESASNGPARSTASAPSRTGGAAMAVGLTGATARFGGPTLVKPFEAARANLRPSNAAAARVRTDSAPASTTPARRDIGAAAVASRPKSPAGSVRSAKSTRGPAVRPAAAAAPKQATPVAKSSGNPPLRSASSSLSLRPSPSLASVKAGRTSSTAKPSATAVAAGGKGDRGTSPATASATKPKAISESARPLPDLGVSPSLPSGATSHATMRSPSSSTTDEPGAITPQLVDSTFLDPIVIHKDGNSDTGSGTPAVSARSSNAAALPPIDHAKLSALSLALSLSPPTPDHRPLRKVSTASVRSMASSAGKYHPASAFDPPPRVRTPPLLSAPQVPEGLIGFGEAGIKGVSLRVGIPCIVSLKKRRARFRANVRYVGHLHGSRGPWIGIETEDPSERFGDLPTLASGSKAGIHYFHLSPADAGPSTYEIDSKIARRRQVERIRDSLARERYASLSTPHPRSGSYGLGLSIPSPGLVPPMSSYAHPYPSPSPGLPGGTSFFPHSYSYGSESRSRTTSERGGYRGTAAAGSGGGASGARGGKRPSSPFAAEWQTGWENPRAMFVRPSEVVFVMGAE